MPDPKIAEPQHSDCKNCPKAAKGSKITEGGKAVVACSTHRMIAVVPAAQPESTPLRCKLAITSLWDKQSPDLEAAGWLAFDNYLDMLRSRGVGHTAAVVTKMKFDPSADFPKVIFSADRWLEPDELAKVAPIAKSAEVKSRLDGSYSINGSDGVKVDTEDNEEFAPAPVAKPAPAPAAAKPKPVAKPKPAPVVEAPAAPVTQAVAEPVATDMPEDVAALLADWG